MSPQEHRERLAHYLKQLEQGAFFDAHETLEAIWFPRRFEEEREMKLLKGFINAAVSFELIKRGRPEPSARVWKNYLKYRPLLEEIASEHSGVYREMAVKVESMRREHE